MKKSKKASSRNSTNWNVSYRKSFEYVTTLQQKKRIKKENKKGEEIQRVINYMKQHEKEKKKNMRQIDEIISSPEKSGDGGTERQQSLLLPLG